MCFEFRASCRENSSVPEKKTGLLQGHNHSFQYARWSLKFEVTLTKSVRVEFASEHTLNFHHLQPDNSSGSRPALQTNVLSRSNSFRSQKQYATSPPRNRHPGNWQNWHNQNTNQGVGRLTLQVASSCAVSCDSINSYQSLILLKANATYMLAVHKLWTAMRLTMVYSNIEEWSPWEVVGTPSHGSFKRLFQMFNRLDETREKH